MQEKIITIQLIGVSNEIILIYFYIVYTILLQNDFITENSTPISSFFTPTEQAKKHLIYMNLHTKNNLHGSDLTNRTQTYCILHLDAIKRTIWHQ